MGKYGDIIWSTPSSGAPIVSIASYGITFNASTIDLLNKPERIKIGYESNQNLVIVKPIYKEQLNNKNIDNSFPFAEREREKGYIRLGNKDFVKYISSKSGLPMTKETVRFPVDWDVENNLLIIDLNKPIEDNYRNIVNNENEITKEE